MNICSDRECMMTPDSGTSLLTAPGWALERMKKFLPKEEGCHDDLHFGNITYVIDGIDYDVPSNHFMERYVNVYK